MTAAPCLGVGWAGHRQLTSASEMMYRYLGWTEAADLIVKGLNVAIGSKHVTYDFARLMDGDTGVKCSEFGSNIIANM